MNDDAKTVERAKELAEYLECENGHGLAKPLRDLLALVERLTLVWSDEKPKVPGLYAYRRTDDGAEGAELFTDEDIALSKTPPYSMWYSMRQFAGPIPAPLEPTPETGEQSCSR